MNKRKYKFLIMILISMYVFIGCMNDETSNKNIDSNQKDQKEIIEEDKEYYGEWLVASDITPDGIPSVYGNEDVEKILGKKVSISKDFAIYDDTILKNPIYDETEVSGRDITYMLVTTYMALGLDDNNPPKMVTIFAPQEKREPWDSMISSFFVKNQDTLIAFRSGLFLKLVRITEEASVEN